MIRTVSAPLRRLLLSGLAPALVVAAVQHTPFFWDTVQLASKHAHFFYANGLVFSSLPPDIDSGHPPLLGYYLAVVWTLFGKTLPVSHWAMWPFLWLLLFQVLRLGRTLAPAWWLPFVVLADPVVATQCLLVGPDLLLMAFFVLALNGLLSKQPFQLAAGAFFLCLVSMRGMLTAGALCLFAAWQTGAMRPALRTAIPFLPGFGAALLFLMWHRLATGWTGFHPGSPWAPAFERVGAAGFFKNVAVLGWRMIDFGRVLEMACLVVLGWRLAAKTTEPEGLRAILAHKWWFPGQKWIALTVVLACCLLPSSLLYANLSAHRYFLPLFLALHGAFVHLVGHFPKSVSWKNRLVVAAGVFLVLGNTWVYPTGISMGWDATLAHLPYHQVRAEMTAYLDAAGIPRDSVASAFPNLATEELFFLNGDPRKFVSKDDGWMPYVLASNVFNDFSKTEIERLERQAVTVRRLQKGGVWMALYRVNR